MDKLLASEVAQVRTAVMAFENSVSQEPGYASAEEVIGAALALTEAVEALSESAKALRDEWEEEDEDEYELAREEELEREEEERLAADEMGDWK